MIIFIVFHIFHNFDFFRPEKIQKHSSWDRFLEIPGWPRGRAWGIRVSHYTGAFLRSHRTKLPALIHFYPEPWACSVPRSGVGPRDPVQEAKPLTPAGQEFLKIDPKKNVFFEFSGRKKSKLSKI